MFNVVCIFDDNLLGTEGMVFHNELGNLWGVFNNVWKILLENV